MKKKGVWLALLALLLLWPAATAFADDPGWNFDGGQIFVDEDVSLESGEKFNGDLGVFDGDLTIPANSVVNGDVFVTNGDIYLAGRVNGDLAVIDGDLDMSGSGRVTGDAFGLSGDLDVSGRVDGELSTLFGSITLRDTAVVHGSLLVLSGSVEREPGAQVHGEQVSEIPLPPLPFLEELDMPEVPEVPPVPPVPEIPEMPDIPEPPAPPLPPRVYVEHHETLGSRIGRFMGRSMAASFFGLIFVGIGVLLVFVWPRNIRQVSDCIEAIPLQSFGLGLLTFLIAAGLEAVAAVLMIIIILVASAFIATVILIPIGILLILLSVLVLLPVPLALAGGMVLGWVALAELIGRRMMKVLKAQDVKPLGAVVVGMLITVGVAATFWLFAPGCCGWPFIILLTSVGLGAVIHTRFGTQSCRSGQAPTADEALPLDAMDEEAGQPDNG
jgi:cytoskeletal protein CcmA (bactofilin family)